MSRLTKYMPAVVGYRERLATLQGAWDSLALLSHLSEDGTNLSNKIGRASCRERV